jgi:hypothetical protein
MATIPELRVGVVKVADFVDNLVKLNTPMTVRELKLLSIFLRFAEVEMHRRPPVKRAPVKRNRVTPAVKQAVWNAYKADPTRNNTEIGLQFNIDGGRVSEILAGYRT